jgi:non-ribosomal peptide synthase protein (TIGR01720 family)
MIRICSELKAGFDITNSLLLKAAVIKAGADVDMLFITAHHLVMDGVSWRILLEDLYNIYTALEREEEIRLSSKTASLLDWERALIEYAASGDLKSEERYWKEIEEIEFHIPQDLMINEWKVADVRKISRALSREKTAFLVKEAHKAYKADVAVLLNVALALTLKEWTGSNLFIIEQEGHGRHWTDVDASRTVGWFTTMYPLKLELKHEDIGAQIEDVKEQMKRTPQQGIGYGIYKYFRKLPYREENGLTEIRLNYLGQFGKELNNDLFAYTSQSTGSDIYPGNSMTAKLDINATVIEDLLNLDISYNAGAYRDDTISWLVNTLFNNLDRILGHVNERADVHLAPTDFDTVNLSDEEWNALFS